jgi:hypothetical protein
MNSSPSQRFVIVDLRIPFFRLVFFFVKAALAVIPAAIILSIIGFVLSALFWAVIGNAPDLMERWKL